MNTREIKFRAWDAVHKCFDSTVAANLLLQIHEETEELDPEYGTRFFLQQFTGLQDKNKKDIYEGDIVVTPKGICEVTYELGCFYTITVSRYRLGGWQKVEVIGNIFENPDLLTPNNKKPGYQPGN